MQTAMLRLDALPAPPQARRPDRVGGDPAGRGPVRRAPVRGPLERRLRRPGLAVGRRRRRRSSELPRRPARPARRGARAAAGRRRRRSCAPRVDRVGAAAGPVGGVSLAAGRARAGAASRRPRAGRCSCRWRPRSTRTTPPRSPSTCASGSRVADGPRAGVATHLVGQGALWAAMQDLSKEDLAKAESAGFPVVLLILLAVFGSFAAAMLPLALGVGSVLLTGALIFGLSQAMEMSVFVTNMASMIGIGVAVDYSLFVVARYREEVARRAARRSDARGGRDGDLRARGAVLRADRDHLARRAVDARQHRDPLDGARRDARRRRRDARRDHAAAGADRAARAARRTRARGSFSLTGLLLALAARRRARLLAALDRRRDAPAGGRRARHRRRAAGARRRPCWGWRPKNGALDQFPRRPRGRRAGFEAAAAVAGAGSASPVQVVAEARDGAAAPRPARAARRARRATRASRTSPRSAVARRAARCCWSPPPRADPESAAAKATVDAPARRAPGRRRRAACRSTSAA